MYWKNKLLALLLAVIGILVSVVNNDCTIFIIFAILAIFAALTKGDIFGDDYKEASTRIAFGFKSKTQMQLFAIYKEKYHYEKVVNGWCLFELWSPKEAREVDIDHLMYIHAKHECYHFFRVHHNRDGERLSYARPKR